MFTRKRMAVAIAASVILLGAGATGANAAANNNDVVAALKSADGTNVGKVRITTSYFGFGDTQVQIMISRPPGEDPKTNAFHGLHIHADDDAATGNGCYADPAGEASRAFTSADGHLMNEAGEAIGDMPSVLLDKNGQAQMTFTTDRLTPSALVGKPIVLHAGPDNFGNIPVGDEADQYKPNSQEAVEKTKKTGNAGDRIACGILTDGTVDMTTASSAPPEVATESTTTTKPTESTTTVIQTETTKPSGSLQDVPSSGTTEATTPTPKLSDMN